MNTTELFKKQIEEGAAEMFFYGLESLEPYTLHIMRHRGSLDNFPADLQFVRMLTDSTPLFKKV